MTSDGETRHPPRVTYLICITLVAAMQFQEYLVSEMPLTGKYHDDSVLIGCGNRFIVFI